MFICAPDTYIISHFIEAVSHFDTLISFRDALQVTSRGDTPINPHLLTRTEQLRAGESLQRSHSMKVAGSDVRVGGTESGEATAAAKEGRRHPTAHGFPVVISNLQQPEMQATAQTSVASVSQTHPATLFGSATEPPIQLQSLPLSSQPRSDVMSSNALHSAFNQSAGVQQQQLPVAAPAPVQQPQQPMMPPNMQPTPVNVASLLQTLMQNQNQSLMQQQQRAAYQQQNAAFQQHGTAYQQLPMLAQAPNPALYQQYGLGYLQPSMQSHGLHGLSAQNAGLLSNHNALLMAQAAAQNAAALQQQQQQQQQVLAQAQQHQYDEAYRLQQLAYAADANLSTGSGAQYRQQVPSMQTHSHQAPATQAAANAGMAAAGQSALAPEQASPDIDANADPSSS